MTDFACATPATGSIPGATDTDGPIDVAHSHCEESPLASLLDALAAHDRLHLGESDDPSAALGELETVDCVVLDGEVGPEQVARLRDRGIDVPAVLYTDAPLDPLLEGLAAFEWVDVVRPSGEAGDATLLAHRICAVVDHRRAADLASLAAAAAESATDGIAVAEAEGTIGYANSQFATHFGHEAADLVGRPWRSLFAAETVRRLEDDALAAVDDGWQWIGTCEGRRADGEPVTLRTRVVDALDDALAFAVFQGADESGDSAE